MSRVQELESRLREIIERARDLQMVPVKSSPGIFVVKAPGTKRDPPSLLIELNAADENNLPTKRRGIYIRTRRDLEEYRKLINDRNLNALISALEEVNGRREEKEESHRTWRYEPSDGFDRETADLELRLSLLSIAPAERDHLGRGEGRTISNAIGVAQMLKEVS
jgi:hypothetical protein